MTRGRSSNGARTPQVRNEPVPEDGTDVLRVRPQGALCKKYSARGREGRSGGRCRRSPLGICFTPTEAFSVQQGYAKQHPKPVRLKAKDRYFTLPLLGRGGPS